MSGKKLSYVRESCFTMDIVVRRGVKKFIISCQRVQTQNDSVSTVSMIHILCLYKTDKFDIIIKGLPVYSLVIICLIPRLYIVVVFFLAL